METKLNIAEILKDKPKGIRLYSPIFGECEFCYVREDTDDICVKKHNGEKAYFNSEGLYCTLGEVMLFPSREMSDWSKFSWKKGDVLANGYGDYCLFKEFAHPSYQTVKAVFVKRGKESIHSDSCLLDTKVWHKASPSCTATYINSIEEKLGGKLNRETLEIEKTQPEFKDGDIVCISGMGYLAYGIVKSIDYSSKKLEYYVLNDMSTLKFEDWLSFEDKQIQPITETQQIILFDALAKEGKAWDSEKKAIVNLKQEVELKPFDKVLVKDNPYGSWEPAIFWKEVDAIDLHPYMVIGGKRYRFCEPYEGNEHFLND